MHTPWNKVDHDSESNHLINTHVLGKQRQISVEGNMDCEIKLMTENELTSD